MFIPVWNYWVLGKFIMQQKNNENSVHTKSICKESKPEIMSPMTKKIMQKFNSALKMCGVHKTDKIMILSFYKP